MQEYDVYGQALEVARHWRSRFQTTYDALRQQAGEGRDAVARAEKHLGGALPEVEARGPGTGDVAEALLALQSRVEDLVRHATATKLRDGLALVASRKAAQADGPLAAWQAAVRVEARRVDDLLAAAGHDDIEAAQATLDGWQAALDGSKKGVLGAMRDSRDAAAVAWEGFAEVRDLVKSDVGRMTVELAELIAGRHRADLRGGQVLTGAALGLAIVGGAVGALSGHGWLAGVGAGLVAGIAGGLVAWFLRVRSIRSRIAAVAAHTAELTGEVRHARTVVRADLARVEAAGARHREHALELELAPDLPEIDVLMQRLEDPAATAELAAFTGTIEAVRASPPRFEIAAVAGTVVMGVVIGTLAALRAPEPVPVAVVEAPSVSPEGGAEPAPVEPEPVRTVAAVDRVFRGGTWSGTFGIATVRGTLQERNGVIGGSLAVTEGGVESTCAVSSTGNGNRVTLKLTGCPAAAPVSARIGANGRSLAGTATRRSEQGEYVDALDLRFLE